MLLWSLKEVAKEFGTSLRTVARMIERGELPYVRIGRLIRVPVSGVHEFVDQRTIDSRKAVNLDEEQRWHSDAKTRPIGGHGINTPMAAVKGSLPAQLAAQRRKRLRQSGK